MKKPPFAQAASRLYDHLVEVHWDGRVLLGPDPVGKLHWRITRFVRSYLPWLPGDDQYVYLQGNAYWIKSLALLEKIDAAPERQAMLKACADEIRACQPEDGGWIHPPIRFRKGYISTVEGTWASLGLLTAYRILGDPAYLEGAWKWYDFQVKTTGFTPVGEGLAANYYAHSPSRIPNVTTKTVWLAEELFQATGDQRFREYIPRMVRFLAEAQLDSGELPYDLDRIHFMCFQYNAFQFMDMANYYDLSGDPAGLEILKRLAGFIATGVAEAGHCRYNCFKETPETNYWTTALAVALRNAHDMGLGDYQGLSDRLFEHALSKQRNDGAFDFSYKTYGLLTDRRAYPRYLAMMFYHLLWRTQRA